MPRKARLDIPGTLHHVMIRGIEKNSIFGDEGDRRSFVDRMSTLVKETGTRILAWSLMENHVHLLILSGSVGLSTFMRRLLTGYAYNFNRKHKRFGHLFQNCYKSIICDLDSYLMELVRYIHLNPLRANVVNTLEELERYPWCGHGVLTGRRKNDWQERDFVLGFFGDKDKKAERSYREFLEAGKDQGRRPELVGGGLIRSMGGWSQVLTLRKQGLKSELSGKRPLFHEHSSLEDNRFPTMILLDLNMPRKDGRQTLKEIKSNPRLLNIPIVIFTTSKEEKDKCFVMKAGADLFITKPSNYEEWVQIMASLAERWLS